MRRIWYSYSLDTLLRRTTLHGLVFGGSLVLFFQLVSVTSVVKNILTTEVGAVPQHLWTTITMTIANGEVMKLVTLGIIVFSLLSFSWSIPKWVTQREGSWQSV